MKRILPIVLTIALVCSCVINGNGELIKNNNNNRVNCITVKPLTKKNIVYSGLKLFNEGSVVNESNLIIKCHIINEKEVCITKLQPNKLLKKQYMQLYTEGFTFASLFKNSSHKVTKFHSISIPKEVEKTVKNKFNFFVNI